MTVPHRSGALRAAFPRTLPVLTGYLLLGTAYGIYMNRMGFGFPYPTLISIAVYAGSMQFVLVNVLLGAFAPLQVLLLTLMVNARHLFYGIAMLTKYGGRGLRKWYMAFALTDETFSVNVSCEPPEGIDPQAFMFSISLLNHFYWVIGATLGGFVGSLIQFDTAGIDFVMTALFVVIFTEQWLSGKGRMSAMIGIAASVLCLMAFGSGSFIIPAMIAIVVALVALKPRLQRQEVRS